MPKEPIKKFPCYVNETHIHEIDDLVATKKRRGEKSQSGKQPSRNNYILEALRLKAKKEGLKTEP